jgi:RNA polymerase sigma-70 factor (ECF subfamily)
MEGGRMNAGKEWEAMTRRVIRAQHGDVAALEQLLHDRRPGLARLAARLCRNEDVAQDVVQETLLKLALNLHRLDTPGAFQSWSLTILRREVIDHARRQQRSLGEGVSYDDARTDMATVDRDRARLERLEIAQCLRRLARDDRRVLSLHYWWGLEVKEIAARLGIAVSAVKTRLFRARNRLREHLCESELNLAAHR